MNDAPIAAALRFDISVDHNPHLAVGTRTVHTIIGVHATEARPAASTAAAVAAEVIIIDKSQSMRGSRIAAACLAASDAIDELPDGTYFAVIAGQTCAELVYPQEAAMVRASALTRAAARRAIGEVNAKGTTSMSTWLRLADSLLARCPAHIKHVLLLTDGHNTERGEVLAEALKACEGHFVCDCRGMGDG
jgi:Mg-chelatase subunit ChlD